ncbi:hypothetical protein CONCODRAFT_13475 [Conidiobolus coronatus NRRL 28638]|uniref:Uncharacterized protein n=1 Tax=Conidiobolus coronatus (strain ATCC 28846 / CBS 209.66 / NRRL 28638) TaxID=796925 RepID=A0A137NQM8_CONC2|nr:hypothetical protein CONCODRAFT_13475 [Conidiobolus coronatus NRRL 28638]|eukprot:KXN65067.1 hypothetical protein CONCODRAFT_13475 [Conidiobolus coronatus NRRL 28638]
MFKLDKSTVLKYYSLTTILGLYSYKLITCNYIKSLNIFIQPALSLNSIFASYYLLYKDNVVLNGSDSLKSFSVACSSEYLLIWELVKLLGKSQDLTIYYTNYTYFGLILLQMGLSQRFPEFFDKFLKLNFGFTCAYIMGSNFANSNCIHILISFVVSISWNYLYDITLDYMTIYCTNFIYSITLFKAIYILFNLIFPDYFYKLNIIIALVASLFSPIIVFIFNIEAQLKYLKNKKGNEDLEAKN